MRPWTIIGRDGSEVVFDGPDAWAAEWQHRVRTIEKADRPAHLRRAGLGRLVSANTPAFAAILRHGALPAVLDALGSAAAADARLSRLEAERPAA